MLVSELRSAECYELLARLGFGRLACARDNQPYIVPIYFAYEPQRLYVFGTLGQKIEWMRANPLVAVEADEVKSHVEWAALLLEAATRNFRIRLSTLTEDNRHSRHLRKSRCGGRPDSRRHRLAGDSTGIFRRFIAYTSMRSAALGPCR